MKAKGFRLICRRRAPEGVRTMFWILALAALLIRGTTLAPMDGVAGGPSVAPFDGVKGGPSAPVRPGREQAAFH
jgi:hypothetical protein